MTIFKAVFKSLFIFALVSNVFATEAQAPTLQFNWPAKGCVPVVEKVLKKGHKIHVQYNLCWKTSAENPEFLIFTYQQYQVQTFDSKPVPAEVLKKLTKSMANIPTFYVRKADGEFSGLEPEALDKCFDIMAEIAADSQKASVKQLKESIKNNPQSLAMFEEAASEPWTAMVAFWHGMDEFGEFVLEEEQFVISCLPAGKDQYELKAYNLSSNAYKDYIKKAESLANSIATKGPAISLDNIDVNNKVSIISDQKLRPQTANIYKRVSLMDKGEQITMEEIHHYTFNWDKFLPA